MSFLDCPNTEEYHTVALAYAKQLHDNVRERAILVLRTKEDEDEAERLRLQADKLEQQVEAEEKKAAEAIRIREAENRRKQIPQPPPRLPTPPPPQVARPAPTPSAPQQPSPVHPAPIKPTQSPFNPPASTPAQISQSPASRPPQFTPQPPVTQLSTPTKQQPSPFQQATAPAVQPPQQLQSQSQPSQPESNGLQVIPDADRLVQIHGNLKKLRSFILTQNDPISSERVRQRDGSMKEKHVTVRTLAGEMRRALTRTMGQLTDIAGSNSKQIVTIRELLEKSLTINSALMQPQHFMCNPPQGPVEGAQHNGDVMPSLFLYLLNVFTKAIVNQLSSEASTNPKIAEPIGIVAHTIISHPKFLWRGQSFVGIIMAKFRTSLPVVFGVRGSETTEQGRQRLGWRKGDNGWISDQEHQDRMRGLGAGYAALCLRNYSKSARVNPWPPSHYWNAMGLLICTPPSERSTTQVIVLTALIDGYERKFLEFYGDMARCAMRAAIIDFPRNSTEKTAAIQTLSVLGDKIKRDLGITL
ncbi:GLE1-like protein-domain-containing protein [Rhexocercosporidium sp. MPI-PUGE-AT-0058]|nr:GLE1-like protein-domain-containing protein [Rhexocercosporidium sp. MPI-PUGE-AT-0058]